MRNQGGNFTQEIEGLNEDLKKCKGENKNLAVKIEGLQKDLNEWKGKNKNLTGEIERLQGDLQEKELSCQKELEVETKSSKRFTLPFDHVLWFL